MLKRVILGFTVLQIGVSVALGQEATNTSSLPADAAPIKGDYGVSFFQFASVGATQLEDSGASVDTYNYLALNRKLTKSTRVSVRIPWLYNTPGYRGSQYMESKTQLHNVHVNYSDYDLGYLGAWKVSGTGKLYFPTSEFSKVQRTIAQLRGEFFFDLPVGQYSTLKYVSKPEYHFQTQKAYIDTTIDQDNEGRYVRDPRRTNKEAVLEHYLELNGDIKKGWKAKPKVGFIDEWSYGSESEKLDSRHVTYGVAGFGIEWKPSRSFNTTLGIENKTKLNEGRADRHSNLFQPENNTIFLMTNATLL